MATFTDITEQKLKDLALRQQFQKEQLIGVIGDRIRQSLNLQEIEEKSSP
ncbi:MAG: hypothetical protein KME06_09785 [Kastovskya adunca ATA6-11-RM4]|nr:hypothetical protein [Kastovskya adunca ATA6-11-RM4]